MNHIPTMTHLHNPTMKPILSSIPPADWCRHNNVKHLCAFCSKWYDCSGAAPSNAPASNPCSGAGVIKDSSNTTAKK